MYIDFFREYTFFWNTTWHLFRKRKNKFYKKNATLHKSLNCRNLSFIEKPSEFRISHNTYLRIFHYCYNYGIISKEFNLSFSRIWHGPIIARGSSQINIDPVNNRDTVQVSRSYRQLKYRAWPVQTHLAKNRVYHSKSFHGLDYLFSKGLKYVHTKLIKYRIFN